MADLSLNAMFSMRSSVCFTTQAIGPIMSESLFLLT